MPDKHLSTQFDSELNGVSSRVMELGGLVESQIRLAIYALSQFSAESANQVIETEARVNAMEIDIDRELSSIIARRPRPAGHGNAACAATLLRHPSARRRGDAGA